MEQTIVSRLGRDIMVDNESTLDIDCRLQIIGRRLAARADAHRPGIEFAVDQGVAPLGIELGGQAIEFGATLSQCLECSRCRVRRVIEFAGVALVQSGQILGNPAIETRVSSAISRRPMMRLTLAAARNLEPSSATNRAANRP